MGCGKDSGVDLGRVIFSGTADLSGFLSALGGSLANALNAHSMVKTTINFMKFSHGPL
jgi:hypothetical protein